MREYQKTLYKLHGILQAYEQTDYAHEHNFELFSLIELEGENDRTEN